MTVLALKTSKMARRRRMHGKRRKKSPTKFVTGIFGALKRGSIGGKKEDASDKAKEKPVSKQENDFVTKSQVRKMIDSGVNKKVPASPKQNKMSEGGSEARALEERLKSV
jgi:hypothetical protein